VARPFTWPVMEACTPRILQWYCRLRRWHGQVPIWSAFGGHEILSRSWTPQATSSGPGVWAEQTPTTASTSPWLETAACIRRELSIARPPDFDPGAGSLNLINAGSGDAFVTKLDSAAGSSGREAWGETSVDGANGIAVATSGNVYTAGYFRETIDIDPGTGIFNLTSAGDNDMFISELDSGGQLPLARGIAERG